MANWGAYPWTQPGYGNFPAAGRLATPHASASSLTPTHAGSAQPPGNWAQPHAAVGLAAGRPPAAQLRLYTGTVKSYCARGYGFIMCAELSSDVYFSRENIADGLRTANIAGTEVHFTVTKQGNKYHATSMQPIDSLPPGWEAAKSNKSARAWELGNPAGLNSSSSLTASRGLSQVASTLSPTCGGVGTSTAGFCQAPQSRASRWDEQAKPGGFGACPAPTPVMPRPLKRLSPHAGSRAIKDALRAQMGLAAGDAGCSRAASSSSGSSESSGKKKHRRRSRSRSRRRSRHKKKKRSSSRERSGKSSSSSSCESVRKEGTAELVADATSAQQAEIDMAKKEALDKLTELSKLEPQSTRMKEWRALLRSWHPDKNPERADVAKDVFQFLQKGKALLNLSS